MPMAGGQMKASHTSSVLQKCITSKCAAREGRGGLVYKLSYKYECNRSHSIYRYSNMAPRLSGQNSIFGGVLFISKSLLGIEKQKKLKTV